MPRLCWSTNSGARPDVTPIGKKYELATFKTEDSREFKAVIHKRVDLEKTTHAVVYAKEAISAYSIQNRRKTILQYSFVQKAL